MINKNLVCVAGLPRAGSTLLCQLLGHHPDIYAPGHSSPLLTILNGLRQGISGEQFMMSQMDVDFDLTYQRLKNAYKGFVNGWFEESQNHCVIDKNRSWLNNIDLLSTLDNNAKVLVCLRNPAQVYGSIETRHQKTVLLDFPDKLAHLSAYERADKLFAKEGVIGSTLHNVANLQDLPNSQQDNLFFVIFEELMLNPNQVMKDIFEWLGLTKHSIDCNNLVSKPHESDSYYNFKYPHKTHTSIQPPKLHDIPLRIEDDIKNNFTWFYENFYPGLLKNK